MGKIAQQNLQFFHTANKKEFPVLWKYFLSFMFRFSQDTLLFLVGWGVSAESKLGNSPSGVERAQVAIVILNIFSMYQPQC